MRSALRKLFPFLISKDGNLMIELALALPLLVLILFSGLDIARYIQLTHKVEQAAESIIDTVSFSENGETEDDLSRGLALAKSILKYGSSYPHISVTAESFKLDPLSNKIVIWSGAMSTDTYSCAAPQNLPDYGPSSVSSSSPSQYFTQVHLCVRAKSDFFSSRLLSLENYELFNTTYRTQVAGFGGNQL